MKGARATVFEKRIQPTIQTGFFSFTHRPLREHRANDLIF